jgi:hypothetical protein
MHTDSKKRRSLLALLFATGGVGRSLDNHGDIKWLLKNIFFDIVRFVY